MNFLDMSGFDERLLVCVIAKHLSLNQNGMDLILKKYPTIKAALEDDLEEFSMLKPKWLAKYAKIDLQKEYDSLQDSLLKDNIEFVIFGDVNYPFGLQVLDNPPLVLYYQGNINKANDPLKITVVGSRQVDLYGEYLCKNILSDCCRLGVGVVSGLALGIDALSHEIAIQNSAYTIGVLGSGLNEDVFYPKHNWQLRNKIIQGGGCVMSEYSPNSQANLYTFPQRNRILAALSEVTWVVQASIKSGSLITALKARDIGKVLATSPSDIRNKFFSGNTKLVKEGCEIITCSDDIFGLLGLKMHNEVQVTTKITFDSPNEEKIYKHLTLMPINIEKLSQDLNIDLGEVSICLTMLEINELVRCTGSNDWIKL